MKCPQKHLLIFAGMVLFLTVFSPSSKAEESRPLLLRNDSPLYMTFTTSALPDRATTVSSHKWAWEMGYIVNNNITEQHNPIESDKVLVDFETTRIELNLKYGLAEHLELGLNIPYFVENGGYMDSFIHNFETDIGAVTPGARENHQGNRFEYLFRVNNQNLIDEKDRTVHGLGDIPLQLKYQFRDAEGGLLPRIAVRGTVKFPSATDPLLGDRRMGAGGGILWEQPIGRRFLIFGNADVTTAYLPTALKSIKIDHVMGSVSFGFDLVLTHRASFSGLTTVSTNPYPKFHEEISALNRLPMGIALGWTYRFPKQGVRVKFAVSENITVAWPDFGWSASLEKDY